MLFLCRPFRQSSFRINWLAAAGVLWLTLLISVPSADAGIIVTFGTSAPDPLVTGSNGIVDVFIHKDPLTLSPEILDGFQVQVGLTPIGGSPVGGLIFSATQAEAQLGETNYVFFGKSASENTSTAIGAVSGGGSLYTGFDTTDDGTGIPSYGYPVPIMLTTTDVLLFRLNLSALAAGTYSIDVNPAVSSFFSDQFDPNSTEIAFSSTARLLTVTGAAAAVPEPASVVFLLVGFTVVALRRKIHRQVFA
jgi:hypothetical protein